MTRLFDGVTGLLTETFGASVTWLPKDGASLVVRSIFRRVPVEVESAEGEAVLGMTPIWRVRRGDLPRLPQRGDRIQTGDGNTYRITAAQEGGSPAGDRFVTCDLEALP